MTLRQLKRKYFIEGFKRGYKRTLTESESWIRDYDRRLAWEDEAEAEKMEELERKYREFYDVGGYEVALEKEVIGCVSYQISFVLHHIFGKEKGTKEEVLNYFEGSPVEDIYKELMNGFNMRETIEGITSQIDYEYGISELDDYGFDIDDMPSDEEIEKTLLNTFKLVAKKLSVGQWPELLSSEVADMDYFKVS